ncbi:colicin immunity domain-containing protein [Serratia fonticola]|uniref:colicin immunity domain-containing protein n=1 Tax=Serratia fonticola TaxID=47917 RepID=UPI00157752EE|nr:colicin immunity domain-containing protein [Serratia fonticola]
MSRMKLIELGRDFLNKKISAEKFVVDIVVERRRLYGVEEPNKAVNQCSGELFIIADCYNPESDRDDYELDEAGLRKEVKATLEKFKLL